jgi:hypothetical protein
VIIGRICTSTSGQRLFALGKQAKKEHAQELQIAGVRSDYPLLLFQSPAYYAMVLLPRPATLVLVDSYGVLALLLPTSALVLLLLGVDELAPKVCCGCAV